MPRKEYNSWSDVKKLCGLCNTIKQKDEFYLPGDPEELNYCAVCEVEHRRDRKIARLAAEEAEVGKEVMRDSFDWMIARLRGADNNVPTEDDIASKLVFRYGGIDSLIDKFVEQHMQAMINKPGGMTVMNGFKMAFGLINQANEMRKDAPAIANMSDEDIMRELQNLAERIQQKGNGQPQPERIESAGDTDCGDSGEGTGSPETLPPTGSPASVSPESSEREDHQGGEPVGEEYDGLRGSGECGSPNSPD